MSQRESDFKGGIQRGTTAFDEESKRLDKCLKECKDEISMDGYTVVTQFDYDMKIKYVGDDCFGFAPDGGAWFKGDTLVAVFEAKKQGEGGNAYERWWDNAMTAKFINPDVKYITFCSGAGAEEGKCLDKLRRKAKIMMGENFVCYNKVEGFTKQEVYDIMEKTLESCQ